MAEITENMRQWLSDLIDAAIDDAEGGAKNEHLWALGSETNEASTMHEHNAEELKQYADVLRDIKRQYVG